jgi:hypothetical protein
VQRRVEPKRLAKRIGKRTGWKLERPDRKALAAWLALDETDRAIEQNDLVEAERLLVEQFKKSKRSLARDSKSIVDAAYESWLDFKPDADARGAQWRSNQDRSQPPVAVGALPGPVRRLLATAPAEAASRLVRLLVLHDGTADPLAAARILKAPEATSAWEAWQWEAVAWHALNYGDPAFGDAARRAAGLGSPDGDLLLFVAVCRDVDDLLSVDLHSLPHGGLRRQVEAFQRNDPLPQPPPVQDESRSARYERVLHSQMLLARGEAEAAYLHAVTCINSPAPVGALRIAAEAAWAMSARGEDDRWTWLERSRQRALACRNEARADLSPYAASAAGLAVRAAYAVKRFDLVVQYGREHPDGEATSAEARDPLAAFHVGAAGVWPGGNRDHTRAALNHLTEQDGGALLEAWLEPEPNRKMRLLRQSWQASDDAPLATKTYMSIADSTDLPLDEFDLEAKGLDSIDADRVRIAAITLREFVSDELDVRAAADRCRRELALVHPVVASLLRLGRRGDAVALLDDLLADRSDGDLHEVAVHLHLVEPEVDLDAAGRHADALLALAKNTPVERRARRTAAVVAHRLGRRADERAHLSWLTDDGDSDAAWSYVGLLLDEGQPAAALGVVRTSCGTPATEKEALIYVTACSRAGDSDDAARVALEMLDRFGLDDDFTARVLATLYGSVVNAIRDQQLVERVAGAAQDFVTRSPGHPLFQSHDASDPELFLGHLTSILAEQKRTFTELRLLTRTSLLPLGIACDVVGATYTALTAQMHDLVRSHHPHPDVYASEVKAADTAKTGTVVADLTTVRVLDRSGLLDQFVETYGDVRVTAPAVDDARRQRDTPHSDQFIAVDSWGQLVRIEPTPEQADAQQAEERRFYDVVTRRFRSVPHPHSPGSEATTIGPGTRPWISAVQVAEQQGWVLACDDTGLGNLGRSANIPVFSTHAWVESLARDGSVTTAEAESMHLALIAGGAVGYLVESDRLAELATTSPIAVSRILEDPTLYDEPGTTGTAFQTVRAAVAAGDRQLACQLHASVLIGLISHTAMTGGDPLGAAAAVTAVAVLEHSGDNELTRGLFGAITWVLGEYIDYTDRPAGLVACQLNAMLSDVEGPAAGAYTAEQVAHLVMSCVRALSPDEKRAALEVVLGVAEPFTDRGVVDGYRSAVATMTAILRNGSTDIAA